MISNNQPDPVKPAEQTGEENISINSEEGDADELVHETSTDPGIDEEAADPDDLIHSQTEEPLEEINGEIDPDDLIHEKDSLDEDRL